jgi:hypothetical protein
MTDEFDDNPPIEQPRLPGQPAFCLTLLAAAYVPVADDTFPPKRNVVFKFNVEMPDAVVKDGQSNQVLQAAGQTMLALATLVSCQN